MYVEAHPVPDDTQKLSVMACYYNLQSCALSIPCMNEKMSIILCHICNFYILSISERGLGCADFEGRVQRYKEAPAKLDVAVGAFNSVQSNLL